LQGNRRSFIVPGPHILNYDPVAAKAAIQAPIAVVADSDNIPRPKDVLRSHDHDLAIGLEGHILARILAGADVSGQFSIGVKRGVQAPVHVVAHRQECPFRSLATRNHDLPI
jgi:hypothetical protein